MEENTVTPELNEEDNYSPYCKVCGACGEDGCCSAMMCKQSPDGDYCQTYLNELRFGYLMYHDTYDLVIDQEAKKKRDAFFDKNWDFIFKQKDETKQQT